MKEGEREGEREGEGEGEGSCEHTSLKQKRSKRTATAAVLDAFVDDIFALNILLIIYTITNIISVCSQWLDPRLRLKLAFLVLFSIVSILLSFIITLDCTCLIPLCTICKCVTNNNNNDISYGDVRKCVSRIFYYFMIFHLIYQIFFVIETIVAYFRCTKTYDPYGYVYDDTWAGLCRQWIFVSYGFSALGLLLDMCGVRISRRLFQYLRRQ